MPKYSPDKDPRKHPDFPKREELSPEAFKNRVRYIWDAWNRVRQNRGLVRVDPPKRLGIETTNRPPINKKGVRPSHKSISFHEWKKTASEHGPVLSALNTQLSSDLLDFEFDDAFELTDSEIAQLDKLIDDLNIGGSSLSDSGAGPSGVTKEASTTESTTMSSNKRQRTDDNATEENMEPMQGVSPSTLQSGHNSASDGGFDSAQGPISILNRGSYRVSTGQMMFQKVHRMKSWAVPFFSLLDTDITRLSTTTPCMYIPWEKPYFYLSPEEFQLLPAGSYIHSVHIEVMHTIASTGFNTGGTTASIATTNHPKIIVIGGDLTKKLRGGYIRKLVLNEEGRPTAIANSTLDTDFPNAQYGTDQTVADANVVVPGAATKIPFYNLHHFCMYQPTNAVASVIGLNASTAPGYEYFSNVVTEVNSNDVTFDIVHRQSYKFESAPIGIQFPALELAAEQTINATGSSQYYNSTRTISNLTAAGNYTISETFGPSNRNSVPLVSYTNAIEQGATFVKGDAPKKPARQPQFFLGMRAIEKNDPSLGTFRSASFVQANIEFEIKATMIVTLPSYPNRFVKPKYYNTSIENAPQGTGFYQNGNENAVVTFGLPSATNVQPALNSVDQINSEPTEDGIVTRLQKSRPRRDIPRVPVIHKPDSKEFKEAKKRNAAL